MIPTLMLVGVVAGRFWIVPLAAAGWAALLLANGSIEVAGVAATLFIATANTTAGVLVRFAAAQAHATLRRAALLARRLRD